jgi:hypothetical protein
MTLLDNLIIIFDRTTNSEYAGFGLNDFMQVEKARRLDLSHVLESINKLNNQVNSTKAYCEKFQKQADNDKLGRALNDFLPKFLEEAGNLMHVSFEISVN